MKVLILAGGSGTRLWPLSRKLWPKQFLKIGEERSLLQKTIERSLRLVAKQDLFIVSSADYYYQVLHEAKDFSLTDANMITEPAAKNTAPAIALGVKKILEADPEAVHEPIFVFPSDHAIDDQSELWESTFFKAAEAAKKGNLVVFGIPPKGPETGFGYIHAKEESSLEGVYKVANFTEKPDLKRAEAFLASGDYYWNAGFFAFMPATFIRECQSYAPSLAEFLISPTENCDETFVSLPSQSIDYELLEKSSSVVLLPFPLKWFDMGSWDSIYEMKPKDNSGNALIGDTHCVDTFDTMVFSSKRVVSTVDVRDLIIIDTEDALLVTKRKGHQEKIKELVNQFSEEERPEATLHTTCFRPWGTYTVLEEREGFKTKRIVVHPGKRLSLQLHHHRDEHWVVVKGTAQVQIGEVSYVKNINESCFIPKLTKHRLENVGSEDLEIIEVQLGDYLEEDDIVRFEDDYRKIEVEEKEEQTSLIYIEHTSRQDF